MQRNLSDPRPLMRKLVAARRLLAYFCHFFYTTAAYIHHHASYIREGLCVAHTHRGPLSASAQVSSDVSVAHMCVRARCWEIRWEIVDTRGRLALARPSENILPRTDFFSYLVILFMHHVHMLLKFYFLFFYYEHD